MENNLPPSLPDEPHSAAGLLAEVDHDRSVLASRMGPPWWVAPIFGVIAALCVASPVAGDNRSGHTGLLIIVAILVVYLYHRTTGVKLSRIGTAAWLIYIATLISCLVLLSVSLGLVSFELYWWVAAPAVAAFAVGALGARYFMRSAANRIRNGS